MEKFNREIKKATPRSGLRSNQAQTASELAIFGAILIFVIGLIVRSAMSTSQVMNQQLKVMRMAMTVSYWSSMVAGNTSRNAASILVIEDRLSVDTANKLGTRERIPLMIGAGAVFSNQLYQPIKYGVTSNLAIFDVFINGQHFPFSTSAFKDIILGPGHPTWEDPCYSIPTATKPIVGGCALAYKVVGNSRLV